MKKWIQVYCLLLSIVVKAQIPTTGMIGGWPFNGNANDMSPSANHGTSYGATLTTDRFGIPNNAYHFNGTSDYIVMMSAGPTGTVSRSVSFWAKTTNTQHQVGFGYGDAVSNGIYQIMFNYTCQGVGFDNSTGALIRGNTTLTDNIWHHIVAVLNSTIGAQINNVDFYVDAVLQPSISCYITTTTTIVNSNNLFPITIGRGANSAVHYYDGDLDDFYLYDRPLSQSEIQALYNYSPCTTSPAAPVFVSGTNTMCVGSSQLLGTSSVTNATSYIWNLPMGWIGSSSSNTIYVTSAGAGTIAVAAVNACGQSTFTTYEITGIASPTLSIGGKLTLCTGETTQLNASGALTYTWSTGPNTSSISISPFSTTIYTVSGTNSLGCVSSITETISVSNGTPPVISVAGPSLVCASHTLNLAVNGASTYTWQPGNLSGFLVIVSPSITTVYTVTGMNQQGCQGTVLYTQQVETCIGTGIPTFDTKKNEINIFPSPAHSQIFLSGLNAYTTLYVFNTYGQTVLSKTIHQNEEMISVEAWEDGMYIIRLSGNEDVFQKKVIKN